MARRSLENHDHSKPGNGGDQLSPDKVDANEVTTKSLTIGGKLYELDGVIDATSTTTTTYTVSGTYDEIIVLSDVTSGSGYDQLQVNGDSDANYDFVTNADAQTTGATQWDVAKLPSQTHKLHVAGLEGNRINFATPVTTGNTARPVGGRNLNVSPPITQLTFFDGSGRNRSLEAIVCGRSVTI